MAPPDRLELLRSQTALTGIDFLHVHGSQVRLDVYFHVEPDTLDVPLVGDLDLAAVVVTAAHDPGRPAVPVVGLSWPTIDGRVALRIDVAETGGFAAHRLRIDDARLDPFFADVPLSFVAGCPSRLDCAPRTPPCPDELPPGPPTDWTARDFHGLRRLMLDAARLLEPGWTDRLEADAVVMLTEVLASVGDELSYTQDRLRWESTLTRATQRRSQRRHAQLVDHRVHDGCGASTWLVVTAGGMPGIGTVPAGTAVWARAQDGTEIPFAVGAGLRDELDGVAYGVDSRRNALTPHIPDASATCLPAGAVELAVTGHVGAAFPDPGDPVLLVALHERPGDAGVATRTWVLPVTSGTDHADALVADPATGTPPAPVTVLRWDAEHAPPFDLDLTATTVRGNVVPATAGATRRTEFAIAPGGPPGVVEAVERAGPAGSVEFLHSLPDPDGLGLVWRPAGAPVGAAVAGDLRAGVPELVVLERRDPDPPVVWPWRPVLVGPGAATPDDQVVTLDDGTWGPAVTYRRPGGDVVHSDLLSGQGWTIRFGTGEFGAPPGRGSHFEAVYRVGNGPAGNVPAGAIRHHAPIGPLLAGVENLRAATDGTPPETAEEIRRVAPHEWRTTTYRAVRTEDYAEALTRLPWVQAAGARTAWTGSWLAVVATPDPRDAVTMQAQWRASGQAQLDRFRQAGRDAWLADPRYADLDIDVTVCVEPTAYRGDVAARVTRALLGDPLHPAAPYFFDPDHVVFGSPLHRAALEAAVQAVPGVRAVEEVRHRRRGHHGWQPTPEVVTVGAQELLRVGHDPRHPERGTLRVLTRGGA